MTDWGAVGEVVCLEAVAGEKKIASACERGFGRHRFWGICRQVIEIMMVMYLDCDCGRCVLFPDADRNVAIFGGAVVWKPCGGQN